MKVDEEFLLAVYGTLKMGEANYDVLLTA